MPVAKLQLDARDLNDLNRSGLTEDTIRANGLHTKNAALVFPYRDLHGHVNGYKVVKPHKPRRNAKGQPIKYEQPAGEPPRLYIPASCVDALREGEQPIYIVEGQKKALRLAQEDVAVAALCGVWNWKQKGTENLLPDLEAIAAGRKFIIVFDYDTKPGTRKDVSDAANRFAAALYAAGAVAVERIELPPGPDKDKQGVDDYLVANGSEAFFGLQAIEIIKIINAGPPATAASSPNKVIKIITPTLGDAAYHGPMGNWVRAISPHTEATDAGLFAHLLPAVGTLIGPNTYVYAGGNQPPRLNVTLVGDTSTGRKGTAEGIVHSLMKQVDAAFWNGQCVSGLSSGEGLIEKVADRYEVNEDGEKEKVEVEKRLIVIEPEFVRVLANTRREGNVLSPVMREAYDSGRLGTLTVTPRQANDAHVSIVGHITPAELKAKLNQIEMANGFGNRFLWLLSKSEKVLPFTKPLPPKLMKELAKRLQALNECKSKTGSVQLSKEAQAKWEQMYPQLREDRPGLVGAMTARGSSMVLRIALIYALVDDDHPCIEVAHLEAALAIWDYSCESVKQLFSDVGGNELADKVLGLLSNGAMKRTQFNSHLSPEQKREIEGTLAQLVREGKVTQATVKAKGPGRPAEVYELAKPASP